MSKTLDITLCEFECQLSTKCHRHFNGGVRNYSKSIAFNSFFVENPSRISNGKFECEMFWGETADYLLEQLKSITGWTKKNKTTKVKKKGKLQK